MMSRIKNNILKSIATMTTDTIHSWFLWKYAMQVFVECMSEESAEAPHAGVMGPPLR